MNEYNNHYDVIVAIYQHYLRQVINNSKFVFIPVGKEKTLLNNFILKFSKIEQIDLSILVTFVEY